MRYKTDEKNHLLYECKVIAPCELCRGMIYLREFTDHLLEECDNCHEYQRCRKCGMAFEINEINEHIASGVCKAKKGYNWERCQFCFSDVLADDNEWIEHAKKCPHLPEKEVFVKEHLQENQRYSS
jgi:hypothetical protein